MKHDTQQTPEQEKELLLRFLATYLFPALTDLNNGFQDMEEDTAISCGSRSANNSWKTSLHTTISTAKWIDIAAQRRFMQDVIFPKLEDQSIKGLIDWGVWTKRRLMRLPGSSKAADKTHTPLRMIQGSARDMVITVNAKAGDDDVITHEKLDAYFSRKGIEATIGRDGKLQGHANEKPRPQLLWRRSSGYFVPHSYPSSERSTR
jgi:hypothetical protein